MLETKAGDFQYHDIQSQATLAELKESWEFKNAESNRDSAFQM